MTVLTKDQQVNYKDAGNHYYLMDDNVHIYKGQLVSVDTATGYVAPAADTASWYFTGIANNNVDNTVSGHTAGATGIKVLSGRHFLLTGSGFTLANSVGQPIYAVDANTVGLSSSNSILVGICTGYVSATQIWVWVNAGPAAPVALSSAATGTFTSLAAGASTFPMTGLAGSGSGAGGTVAPVGGTGGATGAGGAATLTGGAGGATSGTGGAATITGGAGSGGNSTGGAATLTGGAGHGTSNGGVGTVTGGAGGATSGVGGVASVVGGAGGGSGAGGAVAVTGGISGATSGNGGAVAIAGGSAAQGGTSGTGGAVTVTGGAGNATSGNGGAVTLTGGAATSGSGGNGGNVNLVGGANDTGGTPGEVQINGASGFSPVNWTYNVPTNLYSSLFTASRAYRVKDISGYPSVAGTGGACTAAFWVAPSGTALASGTALHTGSFNLVGTINTKQTLALAAIASLAIASGSQIGVVVTGTATSAVGSVTITLEPV